MGTDIRVSAAPAARKRQLPHGVFQRDGIFWIRYQDQYGKIRREEGWAIAETSVSHLSEAQVASQRT